MKAKSKSKQFCKYGHDTFICGRDGGWCNDCKKDWKNRPHIIKKQFCPKGHDTFIVGRNQLNGICNQCIKDKHPLPTSGRPKGSKNKNPRKRTQFCPKGHDKDIVGRLKNGTCKLCARIVQRIDPTKDSRFKRFCIKNHDTSLVGRSKEGNCKQCQSNWMVNKIKKDIPTKLKARLRNRIRECVKKGWKGGSLVKDLGCSMLELKDYIASKFYANMTWENWGTYWQLDHIDALWKFDLTNKEQFKKAIHYTNMQPLTIVDHRKKNAKDMKEYYKHLKELKK
jgi:hypothetical protein